MNKKSLKKVGFLLILMIGLGIIGFLSVRIWLGYRFDSVVKELDYEVYSDEIKNSQALPERLYDAYDQVFNYNQNTTTNYLLMKIPFNLLGFNVNRSDCPCVEANYGFVTNFWDRLSVGIQLDNDAGSKKCLDYYLSNFDFLYGQIGVRNASKYYFNKSLEALKEKEFIELCIMMKNPSLYNKKSNPDNLKKELLKTNH